MNLVTVWFHKDGQVWERKLVDAASLGFIEPEPIDWEKFHRELEEENKRAWAKREAEREAWRAEYEAEQRELDLAALDRRIEEKMDLTRYGFVRLVLRAESDHDFIEAMFALYSQARSRLLQL